MYLVVKSWVTGDRADQPRMLNEKLSSMCNTWCTSPDWQSFPVPMVWKATSPFFNCTLEVSFRYFEQQCRWDYQILWHTRLPCLCPRIVFWRKDNNFLELERRDALSAAPTYNCQNVPERWCANGDVMWVIMSAIEDNYRLNSLLFSLQPPTGQHPWAGPQSWLQLLGQGDYHYFNLCLTYFYFVFHSIVDVSSVWWWGEPVAQWFEQC